MMGVFWNVQVLLLSRRLWQIAVWALAMVYMRVVEFLRGMRIFTGCVLLCTGTWRSLWLEMLTGLRIGSFRFRSTQPRSIPLLEFENPFRSNISKGQMFWYWYLSLFRRDVLGGLFLVDAADSLFDEASSIVRCQVLKEVALRYQYIQGGRVP